MLPTESYRPPMPIDPYVALTRIEQAIAESLVRHRREVARTYDPRGPIRGAETLVAGVDEFLALAVASGVIGNFPCDAVKRLFGAAPHDQDHPVSTDEILGHVARSVVTEQCVRHDIPIGAYEELSVGGPSVAVTGAVVRVRDGGQLEAEVYVPDDIASRSRTSSITVRINTAGTGDPSTPVWRNEWLREQVQRSVTRMVGLNPDYELLVRHLTETCVYVAHYPLNVANWHAPGRASL